MSRFAKGSLAALFCFCISLSAFGSEPIPHEQNYGNVSWQTKLNNFIDYAAMVVNSLTTLRAGTKSTWTQIPAQPTYVDSTNFTMPGDLTAQFAGGRRVWVDLGVEVKPNRVAASNYVSGATKVTLKTANLTQGITGVAVTTSRAGVFGPGTLVAQDHGAPGKPAVDGALALIGARPRRLMVGPDSPGGSEAWIIDADLTIPANVTFAMERGAVLTRTGGSHLTIVGPFECGLWQCINDNSINKDWVVFQPGAVTKVYPQWWGADPSGASDSTLAINAAAASVAWNGYGGEVYCPAGVYKIATTTGQVTLPNASGEPVTNMNYCLFIKNSVKLVGDQYATKFVGDWVYGTSPINTIQKIMVYLGDLGAGNMTNQRLEGISFQNAFIALFGKQLGDFNLLHCDFANCGFPLISQILERCKFDNVNISNCGAGIVNGGWWTHAIDGTKYDSGGYADKTVFNRIFTLFNINHTAYEDNLDAFFDTYFYQHTKGLAGTPYLGVVQTAITQLSRYGRESFDCTVDGVYHHLASRYALYGGPFCGLTARNIYAERVGYANKNTLTKFGVNYTNPFVALFPNSFTAEGKLLAVTQIDGGLNNVFIGGMISSGCAGQPVSGPFTAVLANFGYAPGSDLNNSGADQINITGPYGAYNRAITLTSGDGSKKYGSWFKFRNSDTPSKDANLVMGDSQSNTAYCIAPNYLTISGDTGVGLRFRAGGGIHNGMVIEPDGGIWVGNASGGSKGAGTLNCAGDIYKNGSAFTNPDYVLEKWANGRIEKFADKPGAKDYQGTIPLAKLEKFLRDNQHLPTINREPSGAFERADMLLAALEEAIIYLVELNKRIEAQEKEIKALKAKLQ